jgi:hypothetical protein
MSMTVRNMVSTRTGNPVANQFIIEGDNKAVFQSYESTIAEIDYNSREIRMGKNWNYSPTTSKYRNAFFSGYFDALNNRKAIETALEVAKINGYALVKSNNTDKHFKVYFDYEI